MMPSRAKALPILKAIHAQEDRKAAEAKAKAVVQKLKGMRLTKAAQTVEQGACETLSYMSFAREYWPRIRTNNPLERIMREIRRRTRGVGCFPDGDSAWMLVAARLRHVASTRWGTRVYLNPKRLREAAIDQAAGSSCTGSGTRYRKERKNRCIAGTQAGGGKHGPARFRGPGTVALGPCTALPPLVFFRGAEPRSFRKTAEACVGSPGFRGVSPG